MISADTFWKSGIQSPIGAPMYVGSQIRGGTFILIVHEKHSELCGMYDFLLHSAGFRVFFLYRRVE